ncbi:anaphase promoting complex subunit cdc16 [Irineochytrium annulatum]|nr:anaphase promoting complex subunit cdc16 [Irineochytrium annulatum]
MVKSKEKAEAKLERLACRLRVWIRAALDENLLKTACFWAGRLVSITGDTRDVRLLAQSYIESKQYSRAIALVKNSAPNSPECLRIMAECNMRLEAYDDALETLCSLLEGPSCKHEEWHGGSEVAESERRMDLRAVCLFLQGQAHFMRKQFKDARDCFKSSLRADVRCYEVKRELLKSLPLREQLGEYADFVRNLYGVQGKKYDADGKVEDMLENLDRDYKQKGAVQLYRADVHNARGRFEDSYRISEQILAREPLNLDCMWIHVSNLHHLHKTNELFLLAHELVDKYPGEVVSWFAVGCYYLLEGMNHDARAQFSKAIAIEKYCAYGWIGLGHAAAADGDDQPAIEAYAHANKLFRGMHLPSLYIGMQYLKTSNAKSASQYLKEANEICSKDPLVENELGIFSYQTNNFEKATKHFERALKLSKELKSPAAEWSNTSCNLGKCYLKLRKYHPAREQFKRVKASDPANWLAYSLAGVSYQEEALFDCDNDGMREALLTEAIECYHHALSRNPDDTNTADLLTAALEDISRKPIHLLAGDIRTDEVAAVEGTPNVTLASNRGAVPSSHGTGTDGGASGR